MAKNDNLKDFLVDVANAIREKKGTTDPINPQNFSDEIASLSGGNKYTGHADVEGLKAIGWTDEDIAYYQENGVNWNKEEDEYHKVTDDNKALYGVLTADNISTYNSRIVYLPKIDTSGMTNMQSMFSGCLNLKAIPQLDTSNVTNMVSMFYKCCNLITIPQLDTSKVTDMSYMFTDCKSLITIPQLNTSKVTDMQEMFNRCYSLTSIPQLNTSNVINMSYMFSTCRSLVLIPLLDTSNVEEMNYLFNGCSSLTSIPAFDFANAKGVDHAFADCFNLREIPPLNMPRVHYDCAYMFYQCIKLKTITELNIKISFSDSTPFYGIVLGAPCLETIHISNISNSISFQDSPFLNKDSLLYMINNATSMSTTITLNTYTYERLANDPDIVEALANHPKISIAQ